MLNAYTLQVQSLLHDANAQFYPTSSLTTWINTARLQIALEGECINRTGTINTVMNQATYLNSAVTTPSADVAGLVTPVEIILATNPAVLLEKRNWSWFRVYSLTAFGPSSTGTPAVWSPQMVGDTGNNTPVDTGQFVLSPTPSGAFTLTIDGLWTPINLAVDGDSEAIPYPFTEAVQYYAAYMALLDAQRKADAQDMFQLYEEFMRRARGIATPLSEQRTYLGGMAARRAAGQAPPDFPPSGAGGAGRRF